jgi:hypothetical protein
MRQFFGDLVMSIISAITLANARGIVLSPTSASSVGWLARPIVIQAAWPAPGASSDRRAGRRGHRRPSSRSDRKHASPQDALKAMDHPQRVARIAQCRPHAGGKSPSRKSRAYVEALQQLSLF